MAHSLQPAIGKMHCQRGTHPPSPSQLQIGHKPILQYYLFAASLLSGANF